MLTPIGLKRAKQAARNFSDYDPPTWRGVFNPTDLRECEAEQERRYARGEFTREAVATLEITGIVAKAIRFEESEDVPRGAVRWLNEDGTRALTTTFEGLVLPWHIEKEHIWRTSQSTMQQNSNRED